MLQILGPYMRFRGWVSGKRLCRGGIGYCIGVGGKARSVIIVLNKVQRGDMKRNGLTKEMGMDTIIFRLSWDDWKGRV
jgi:hypothetical protein